MTSEPPAHDPITAILIAVTEIRGNLRACLDRLERHQHQLDAHALTLIDHGERIVALESRNETNDAGDTRTVSARAVLWAAVGVGLSVISVLVGIYLALRGGQS